MLSIKKTLDHKVTIPELVNFILSTWLDKEVSMTEDQERWLGEFMSLDSKVVHLKGDHNSGRTSTGIGMIVATALLQPQSRLMVMTKTAAQRDAAAKMARDFFLKLSEALEVPEINQFSVNQKHYFEHAMTGSHLSFYSCSQHATQGRSLDCIFLDFPGTQSMEDLDNELMVSIYPVISASKNSKMIVALGE